MGAAGRRNAGTPWQVVNGCAKREKPDNRKPLMGLTLIGLQISGGVDGTLGHPSQVLPESVTPNPLHPNR
jgi:hypothetical protein